MVNILAIDPSLTHTAGFHAMGLHCSDLEIEGFAVQSSPKEHAHPVARLAALRDQLRAHLVQCASALAPGLVFVEGYAFGAKCAREALGEWGGQVRLLAYELGWTVVVVPPSSLKAFVCGKGNAPKEQMILQIYKRWAYEAPDNNAADAYALMQLGLAWHQWREGGPCSKATAELCRKLTPWAAREAA
jgi:Holliday junction resolvasome RuvABC endonuclease subunit